MFPEYSLLILKPIYSEEYSCIECQDIQYVEENYSTTGYKFFTEEEKEGKYKWLSSFMTPIMVFLRGKLVKRYVVDVEVWRKYYPPELKRYLPKELGNIAGQKIVVSGRVQPGYFTLDRVVDMLPVFQQDIDDLERTCPEYTKNYGYGIVFHTFDRN